MRQWFAIGLGSMFSLVASPLAAGQCHYRVTILPTLDCSPIGFDGGTPYALNDYGQVAGKHSHCLASGESPFAWAGGPTIGTIPLPQGVVSAQAFAISNVRGVDGVGMVGGMAQTVTQYRPFIWFNGQWQFLSYGKNTSPGAVNALSDQGLAVGYTTSQSGWKATVWVNGIPQLIQVPYGPRSLAMGVSSSGMVTGWMGVSDGIDSHAFVWSNGNTLDIGVIPDAPNGKGIDINRFGEVVVGGDTDHTQPPGFWNKVYRWKGGEWTDLGMLPGYNSTAGFSINDRGEIVGISRKIGTPGTPETGWIWRSGVLSDLSNLTIAGSGMNGDVFGSRAINNEGQIVAQANVSGTVVSVILSPVPDHLGDTNCDGVVNIDDIVNIITRWGPCSHGFCSSDLNGNGAVDLQDLVTVILNWSH